MGSAMPEARTGGCHQAAEEHIPGEMTGVSRFMSLANALACRGHAATYENSHARAHFRQMRHILGRLRPRLVL